MFGTINPSRLGPNTSWWLLFALVKQKEVARWSRLVLRGARRPWRGSAPPPRSCTCPWCETREIGRRHCRCIEQKYYHKPTSGKWSSSLLWRLIVLRFSFLCVVPDTRRVTDQLPYGYTCLLGVLIWNKEIGATTGWPAWSWKWFCQQFLLCSPGRWTAMVGALLPHWQAE